MELRMSYYGHKNIPHAKFESDSSSSFGDTTSQKFRWKKGKFCGIPIKTSGARAT